MNNPDLLTDHYEKETCQKLSHWRKKMLARPSFVSTVSKNLQTRLNDMIPEKVHKAITATLKQMIRAVLFGSTYITARPTIDKSLEERETDVLRRIKYYRNTAAVEGGLTGAGGIFLGLADFPALLTIKLKLLFDIASIYGFSVKDYKERLYLLRIFELAFSSDIHRRKVFLEIQDWDSKINELPEDINQFDWRNFQQEYRDYIDLAKMAQLIPWIGAPVGAIVNYRLLKKLGYTAMNAYRMRLLINECHPRH